MKARPIPTGVARNDNELVCWGGDCEEGWSFHVILFRGQPYGEIRFLLHGAPKFTQPIGLEEIAMFEAERDDLIVPFITGLIQQHQPH